jgi:hypothetical protein
MRGKREERKRQISFIVPLQHELQISNMRSVILEYVTLEKRLERQARQEIGRREVGIPAERGGFRTLRQTTRRYENQQQAHKSFITCPRPSRA